MIVNREELLTKIPKGAKVAFITAGFSTKTWVYPQLKYLAENAKNMSDIVVFIPIPVSLIDTPKFIFDKYNGHSYIERFLDELNSYISDGFVVKDNSLYSTKYILPENFGLIEKLQLDIKNFFTDVMKIQIKSKNIGSINPFITEEEYPLMGEDEKEIIYEHQGFVHFAITYLSIDKIFNEFLKDLNLDNSIIIRSADQYFGDRLESLCIEEYPANLLKRVYLPIEENIDGTVNFYNDGIIECDTGTLKSINKAGDLKKYLSTIRAKEWSNHSFKNIEFLANVDYKTLQPVKDTKEIDSDVIPVARLPKGRVKRVLWIWNTKPDTSVLEVSGEDIKFIDNVL